MGWLDKIGAPLRGLTHNKWADSLLHPENAYKQAQGKYDLGYLVGQDKLNQGYNQSVGFLKPIQEHGDEAWKQLQPQFQKLLNPGGLQDEWIKGYEPSQYAQGQAQISREHGANALSSLGLLGSTPGAKAVAAAGSDIMLRDRQNYLNDLMQKYLTGINLTSGIYNQGVGARGQASGNAMQWGNLGNENAMRWGDWSATNAANQQSAPGRLLGNLLGTGASLGSAAMFGPAGPAMLNQFGVNPNMGNAWSTHGGMQSQGPTMNSNLFLNNPGGR